jgi:hypothetical protein
MKKILLLVSLLFIGMYSYGQWDYDNYDLNFEQPAYLSHVIIDTISNPNNIWQIGRPAKTVFTAAQSPIHAVITDTLNSYPVNNTSSFIIKNVAYGGGFVMPHTVILAGWYFVNSDSLSDFGKIEFSPDLGATWIDIINDPTYTPYIYSWPPVLTGNSNGWQYFWFNIAQLGPIFNIHDFDTIMYRFSFISDSIQTNKDGLMFDDFHFEDWVEDVPEYLSTNSFSILPNPAHDNFKVSVAGELEVYNSFGEKVYQQTVNRKQETINCQDLKAGVYFAKVYDGQKMLLQKLLIE